MDHYTRRKWEKFGEESRSCELRRSEQISAKYPGVTAEALRAVFAFAADVLQEEGLFALRPAAG